MTDREDPRTAWGMTEPNTADLQRRVGELEDAGFNDRMEVQGLTGQLELATNEVHRLREQLATVIAERDSDAHLGRVARERNEWRRRAEQAEAIHDVDLRYSLELEKLLAEARADANRLRAALDFATAELEDLALPDGATLSEVTVCALPLGHKDYRYAQITVHADGAGRWTVRAGTEMGCEWLTVAGREWDFDRSDAARFPSLNEALAAALAVAPDMPVGRRTAAEVLADAGPAGGAA